MSTTIDDVAQTLADYERLAITSGARVQIDPPEFSADGEKWVPFWLGETPPVVARSTVHRDGIPTTVYVVWDESLPIETAMTNDGRRWRDLWLERPTARFGSFATRSSLRRAFREVIGDRVEPDEDAPKIAEKIADQTDWDTQLETAPDVTALDLVWKDMREARARNGERERAYKIRRAALSAAEWEPAELARVADISEEKAAEVIETGKPGRAPQDHLPAGNRAQRRAKKKGRR